MIAPTVLALLMAAAPPSAAPPSPLPSSSVSQGADALLAAARAALGGNTLDSVTSFTATGTFVREMGPLTRRESAQISVQRPDKFHRVTRTVDGSRSFQISTYIGVNGNEPLDQVVAPGAPMPMFIPAGPEPQTAEEKQAALDKRALSNKKRFVELMLPLFAESVAIYPVQFTSLTTVRLPSGMADVVEAKSSDGFVWRLFIDSATKLPVRIAWLGRPIRIVAGRPSPNAPDPTIGMPDVEWHIRVRDHRMDGGVNWPRVWTTYVNGEPFEELEIDRYRINPKIDPKIFKRQ